VSSAGEVGAEHAVHHLARRVVGRNTVHRSQVLLDVHRDPFPPLGIAWVCTEPHGRWRRRCQRLRNDRDKRTGVGSRSRDLGEAVLVAGDDDDAAQERLRSHVRSLHVPA
jgi:hypothetical protein